MLKKGDAKKGSAETKIHQNKRWKKFANKTKIDFQILSNFRVGDIFSSMKSKLNQNPRIKK